MKYRVFNGVVAYPRSGTTYLSYLFDQIPDIRVFAESNFFSVHFDETMVERYSSPHIDISPAYLKNFELVLPRLNKYFKEKKYVVILRNPVEYVPRLFEWLKTIKHLEGYVLENSFSDFIKKNPSFYQELDYSLLLENLPKSSTKIILFDDLINNPSQTLSELLDFFNISADINSINYDLPSYKKNSALRYKWAYTLQNMIVRQKKLKDFLKKVPLLYSFRSILEKKKEKIPLSVQKDIVKHYKKDIKKIEKKFGVIISWKLFSE